MMSSLHRRESEVSEKRSEDSYEASIQQEEGIAEWSESIIPKDQDAFGQPCTRIESHHTVSSFQAKFPGLKRTASNVLSKVESRMTTKSIVDPGPPPDGGLKAWTQVLMAWITVFSTWGYVNSFGAFQTYYTETLNIAPSTVSWIGSVQVWILFFIGVFSGRALDAGYFLPTFLIGVVIQLIGIFMMSLSTNYWQLFLTQGVATGIGGGIFFCPAMALVNTYFSKNRGIAVGISSTGNATGGMIYPIIVRQLLPKVGFAWTVRTIGFLNLFCLCIVLYFMRPRLPPRKSGPIIEFSAFKDPVYALFVSGMFFIIGPLYFIFYYVSLSISSYFISDTRIR
jgi:MFS family permease